MKPLISIIIPNRNHGHALPMLFDSILAQTLREVEVVVSDDYSDIPYTDVLEAYRSKGLNIRFITAPQRLYTKNARLAGIKASTADIIAFADADDLLWGTEVLEKHVRQFIDNDLDVLQFRSGIIDAHGDFTSYFNFGNPFMPAGCNENIFTTYLRTPYASDVVWNKLYSRAKWLEVLDTAWKTRFYRYAEDTYLTPLFLFHARKYAGSEHVGYGYRFVSKRNQDTAERTIYAYLMLEEVLPYYAKQGCSEETLRLFSEKYLKILRVAAGRLSLAASEGFDPQGLLFKEALRLFDKKTLTKAMIVATALNAEVVRDTIKSLQL